MDAQIQKRIDSWLTGDYDEQTKAEIRRLMKENPKELENAFFKELSFGTGGMREIMGIGSHRMNVYTIRTATQGVANYLKQQPEPENGFKVFIGYDVREHSREFAEETARVFAGNGIRVLLSKNICPTPLVSFACRYFHCSAAIVITASHNPPQYNGYKVYWSDGGQVVSPHDAGITTEVQACTKIALAELSSPLIQEMGDEPDAAYLEKLKERQFSPKTQKSLHIVYSNLHGTGIRLVPQALASWGFSSLSLVKLQAPLDGKFPHAPKPNPEEAKTMEPGTQQMMDAGADLFLATDPDADRLGAVVRHHRQPVRLTGNQIACLCLHHICERLKEKGEFPQNSGVVKSIVTTELLRKIALSFGSVCVDVLTGFKYIAALMRTWETSFGGLQFIFGAEESYGYLFETFVRDKDAISASCLLADAANHAKAQGKTLVDQLYLLYEKHGVYREAQKSLVFKDTPEGLKEVKNVMHRLRTTPPLSIGAHLVQKTTDYTDGSTHLPASDVLQFDLADGSKIIVRPSGTEPKIKIYAESVAPVEGSVEQTILRCDEKLQNLLASMFIPKEKK